MLGALPSIEGEGRGSAVQWSVRGKMRRRGRRGVRAGASLLGDSSATELLGAIGGLAGLDLLEHLDEVAALGGNAETGKGVANHQVEGGLGQG